MDSPEIQDFSLSTSTNDTQLVCFIKPTSNGSALWLENSLYTTIPPFALQFAIILAINRIFVAVSASSHVPRIVTNIFTGFLIGPSGLGRWKFFVKHVFPFRNMMPLETVAAVTLVYYVFLIGLEVDLKTIKSCHNKKAFVVAIAGIIFSIPVGCGLYYLLLTNMGRKALSGLRSVHFRGAMIWGIALSCSEFPEIANILSDQKLLITETGQLALTASLISDLFCWIFLAVAITEFYYSPPLSFFSTILLVLACWYLIHPIAKWLFDRVGTGDREFLESEVVFVLHVVLVFGLVTDGLAAHSITGAFLLGVIIPNGVLNDAVQDNVLDFVASFMMPLFFAVIGQRIHIQDLLALDTHWITVVTVIVLAFTAKILCTFMVSWIYRMPLMQGLSLGLLMNTKGIVSIIILSSARDRTQLNNQTFGVMLLTCWLMTVPVGPVLAATKTLTSRNYLSSQRRTMQGTRPDSPLRVLACVHTKRDADAIINLLKASSPSVKSPIQVMAVKLTKMTTLRSRPAASSLIIRNARKPSFNSNFSKNDSFKKDNNNNDNTLDSFDNLSQAIFAEKMRVVSAYNSMHMDIFNLAKHRGVTLILTTLYKQPTYDGLGAGAATARAANIVNRDLASKDEKKVVLENLVKDTPCCLAIFVDRGFGQKRAKEQRLAMFYVGGVDDREALSYAWRMSRDLEVHLTVVRLVWDNPNDEFDETDEEYLRVFQQETRDTPWVRYLEKVVKDEKETVKLLNKVGNKGFDLFIIGRRHKRKMSLAQTVEPVLEEPALGPLGDTLSDLNSAAETSILILQGQAAHDNNGDDSGKHARSADAYDEGPGATQLILQNQTLFPFGFNRPFLYLKSSLCLFLSLR